VQVDFDPAGRFLDGFSVVVWSPAFDKGQAEDALAAEVVDADSGGRRGVRNGRRQVTAHHHAAAAVTSVAGAAPLAVLVRILDRRQSGLNLHLAITLPQVKHLESYSF